MSRKALLSLIISAVTITGVAVLAQETNKDATDDKTKVITSRTDVVVAPTTVLDKDGSYVQGLKPSEFDVYDNDKKQDVRVDEIFAPISLVVAIQANAKAEGALPKIQRLGTMFES